MAGNAGSRLSYALRNLPSGRYYWSVQAVDASFAGSTFAPEMSFVVAPRIQTLRSLPQGQWEFKVSGFPGENYQLQMSSDLNTWDAAVSFQMFTAETNLVHTSGAGSPRFFRLKVL
jgi:hypothetical protein